jgi:uncharacterized membrane protein
MLDKKDSTSYLLYELLKQNLITIDKKELEFQYESHPSYPSLHSITGVLTHFGIENLAIEVPTNGETLAELPKTFIAHIKDEKGEHFVLVKQKNEKVELIFDKKVRKNLFKEAFIQYWTGIIVAVEKSETIEETKEKSVSGKLFYYLGALIGLFVFFLGDIGWFKTAHFIISIVGVVISILIVKHELGLQSAIVDKFCSGNNEKTSCDDVLQSKGATLVGKLKFSDVGLIYFSSLVVSWLLFTFITDAAANVVVFLSLAALPFTLYSLYYQYFVVKKWCPLCLSILAVLWLQAASVFLYDFTATIYTIHLISIVAIGFSFLAVGLLWAFLFPRFEAEVQLRKLKVEHNRFKHNYEIFDALISRNIFVKSELPSVSEIVLGNKSRYALLKIVLVTNPLCGHCKDAHYAIEPLLKMKNEDLQVVIRFNVNATDRNSVDTKIAAKLLAIYDQKGEKDAIQALNEVYSGRSLINWLQKCAVEPTNDNFNALEKEKKWCVANNINFTPEILINSRSFPKEFDITDLQYFVDDLIEEATIRKEELAPEMIVN